MPINEMIMVEKNSGLDCGGVLRFCLINKTVKRHDNKAEEKNTDTHTLDLCVAIEFSDRVHCRGKLKVGVVPPLNSHLVTSLSTGIK